MLSLDITNLTQQLWQVWGPNIYIVLRSQSCGTGCGFGKCCVYRSFSFSFGRIFSSSVCFCWKSYVKTASLRANFAFAAATVALMSYTTHSLNTQKVFTKTNFHYQGKNVTRLIKRFLTNNVNITLSKEFQEVFLYQLW